jgi:hypothetical protein
VTRKRFNTAPLVIAGKKQILSADYSTWARNPEDGNSMLFRNDGTYLRSQSAPTPKNKAVFIVTPMRTSILTFELVVG